MSNFFTKENLTALREIALRRTADQVNKAVMKERQAAAAIIIRESTFWYACPRLQPMRR